MARNIWNVVFAIAMIAFVSGVKAQDVGRQLFLRRTLQNRLGLILKRSGGVRRSTYLVRSRLTRRPISFCLTARLRIKRDGSLIT